MEGRRKIKKEFKNLVEDLRGRKDSLQGLCRVRTLYASVGKDETELSFKPGAIITGVRPSLKHGGWIEGTMEGKVGEVSRNFVKFLD